MAQHGDEDAAATDDHVGPLGLEPGDVSLLHSRTEGWPAGLRLAALSLRGVEDRGAFIRSFAGGDRQIGDYLREVLETVSPRLRDFLLRTSILERMCGSLCDAVVGTNDSGRVLEELEDRNLLVVPLDRRREWYRFHTLFRELLLSEGPAAPRWPRPARAHKPVSTGELWPLGQPLVPVKA